MTVYVIARLTFTNRARYDRYQVVAPRRRRFFDQLAETVLVSVYWPAPLLGFPSRNSPTYVLPSGHVHVP